MTPAEALEKIREDAERAAKVGPHHPYSERHFPYYSCEIRMPSGRCTCGYAEQSASRLVLAEALAEIAGVHDLNAHADQEEIGRGGWCDACAANEALVRAAGGETR